MVCRIGGASSGELPDKIDWGGNFYSLIILVFTDGVAAVFTRHCLPSVIEYQVPSGSGNMITVNLHVPCTYAQGTQVVGQQGAAVINSQSSPVV